ncbi:DUF6777 domain-containing protein, partial [Streptomyces yangpuensis]|uniref:DUF6777 domain-containing protein n=1 Tax=Streptomyces yangpuensis TaxID=1648182 RepID=UPI0036642E28
MSAGTAALVVSAVVVGFTVLGGNTAAGGEVFLEAAAAAGPDPFTPSTATAAQETGGAAPGTTGTVRGGTGGARTLEVDGGHPGLYGGTRNVASCDVEKQIKFLGEHTDKGDAFATTLGVRPTGIPAYLRSLTPVRLGWDTRVTNHGYKNDAPTGYQAILQAGTSVLVDGRGVPRVRCACGNPLTPPVAVRGKARISGQEWSSFRSAELVAVRPAAKPVKAVTVYDPGRKAWYERPSGAAPGQSDRAVEPPPGRTAASPYPALPPAHEGTVRTDPAPPDPAPGRAPAGKPHGEPEKERPEKPTPSQHKDPGPKPGTGRDKDPAHVPGQGSGTTPGEHPGKAPGQEPGSGRGSDKTPGSEPQDPGDAPDKAPGRGSHQDKDTPSGDAPGRPPGKGSGDGTGQVPDRPPGQESDQAPRKRSGD